jgi:hypothetical protein
MTGSPRYPFSDLSRTEVDQLIEAARSERSRALRGLLARLFHVNRKREAQVWTPKNVPALSLDAHC